MSATRTHVGIVTWSRRVREARVIELQIADRLGAALAAAPTGGEKVALARAAARHGEYARFWDRVVPVLHDLDDELAIFDHFDPVDTTVGDDPQRVARVATDQLVERYQRWRHEATPIADAPILRVLDLILIEQRVTQPR